MSLGGWGLAGGLTAGHSNGTLGMMLPEVL